MANVPMERGDIAEFGKRVVADFVARAPGDSPSTTALRITSGTSGNGPVMMVTQTDLVMEGRHYTDSRNVLNALLGSRSTRLKQVMILRANAPAARRIMTLDARDLSSRLGPLLEQFAPDTVIVFPMNVTTIAPHLSEDTRAGVRKIVTSGEQIARTTNEFFQRQFPNARLASFFSCAETGEIAGPCPLDPTRVYHPSSGVQVEIDEPDEGGVGDILVSKTIYRDQKLERYRTGDAGSLSSDVCGCGASPSLRLFGRRGYDFIRIHGLFLLKEEFDRVAQSLSEYITEYRAEVYSTATSAVPRGGIVLSVYRKSGALSAAEVEALKTLFAERLFVTATLTLSDAILNGHCEPLQVIAVSEPFPVQHKHVTLMMRRGS